MTNELRKNAEGYTDPTAAATLNQPEPGDVWEYNDTECLIVKNHGNFSTILLLVSTSHPEAVKIFDAADYVGERYTDPRRVTYGLHRKMGRYLDTLDVEDFERVIDAVEAAQGISLRTTVNVTADAHEVVRLQEENACLRNRLDEMQGMHPGMMVELTNATQEATKARNQLELLREMYNDLLAKVVGGA